MKKGYIIEEELFRCANRVIIKDYGDEFDPWWGWDVIELTREDVAVLLEGKVLESSCAGEYGLLIRLENEPKTSD